MLLVLLFISQYCWGQTLTLILLLNCEWIVCNIDRLVDGRSRTAVQQWSSGSGEDDAAVLQSFSPILLPLVRFAREFHFGERGSDFCTTELYPWHTPTHPMLHCLPLHSIMYFSQRGPRVPISLSSCIYPHFDVVIVDFRPTDPLTVVVGGGGCGGAHPKQNSSHRHPASLPVGGGRLNVLFLFFRPAFTFLS